MPRPRLREVVLEIDGTPSVEAGRADSAARALLSLPGVTEAHVDEHHTWAMVTFDPRLTTIAAITGCLAAQGLRPFRVRPLLTDSDACE